MPAAAEVWLGRTIKDNTVPRTCLSPSDCYIGSEHRVSKGRQLPYPISVNARVWRGAAQCWYHYTP
jgi:hypothetical protein